MKPKTKPWQSHLPSEIASRLGNVIGDVPWQPNKADAVAASAALALTIALLRGLRDRGVLSKGEIDDLLADAADQLAGTGSGLIDRVRASLDQRADE